MNTQVKSYANFNTVSFQGRIFNAELVNGQYGEFLAITVITNLADDDDGITVTFNNSNGLMTLFQNGYLPTGRQVTVTGRIEAISETYTNKDGEVQLRKRPEIKLDSKTAQAHLGAMPATDKPMRAVAGTVVKTASGKTARRPVAVDPAPEVVPAF